MKYRSFACKRILKTGVCWYFTPCQPVVSSDWYVGTDIPKDLLACVRKLPEMSPTVELLSYGLCCHVDTFHFLHMFTLLILHFLGTVF